MARKPSTVSNPWLGISWSDPVANIDKADLAKLPFKNKLQLDTLPEPYTTQFRQMSERTLLCAVCQLHGDHDAVQHTLHG